jgi:DNA-directed RNA polymerase specialized sigma24 family protein
MIGRAHIPVRGAKADRYASRADFRRIIDEDLDGLYQLSFLLTGTPENAQRCFVSGLGDCVTGNPVFREWAHTWAERIIIQNAIKELKPRPKRSNSPLSATIFSKIDQLSRGPDRHFEIDAVLGLEDFERFVFVISILEHYSEQDCALLLGCSVQQVREARARALQRMASSGRAALARERLIDSESDRADVLVEAAHETIR